MATAAAPRVYKNFINGQWVDSSSGKTIPNINPANTDDIIGHAPQSTREEAQAAGPTGCVGGGRGPWPGQGRGHRGNVEAHRMGEALE